MSSFIWPRQDIPQKDKDEPWKKSHLDYAESVLIYGSNTRSRMSRLFMGYNGIKTKGSLDWLTNRYGEADKATYIAYRLGRTKIDLLQGEFLKRPLQATVTTINSEAMSDKMRQHDRMMGAMLAKDEIGTIKKYTGVDLMEGVPIPESEDDPVWKRMSFKDKAEDMMQTILDNQIKELDLKKKLADGFKNCEITNYVYGQIERTETGDIEYWNIDPRDAIFEAIDGDDYMEKSPIMGCRKWLPVHTVLMKYKLTAEQREQLETARKNPSAWWGATGQGRGFMRDFNGQLEVAVLHIVWKSVTPTYYKIVESTATQLLLEPDKPTRRLELDTLKYEKNKDYHDKMVDKGEYTIETTWREEEYEATRIGGIIDINMRPTYFQKHSTDKPSHVLSSTYVGYVHGRTDGVTVSLQQVLENFENIYDIVMYQILKDVVRAKGKVITIDRAGLGILETLDGVIHKITNDGVLDIDSAQAGQNGSRYNPNDIIKTIDLGLSDNFAYLVTLRNDIRNEMNLITGINENRMGQTAASSTATAQQADISNSRTITEALFYGYSGFTKRVLMQIINASAISWAFYKLDKGEQILGSEKFNFLQITKEIGYRDYGVFVEDGSAYMEISQKIEQVMQLAINAKTIDTMDVMNVLLAETLAKKKAFLREAMERMNAIAQEQQAQQQQAQAQIQEAQMQTQLQIAAENREDLQKNEKDNIVLSAEMQMAVDDNKAKANLTQQYVKGQQEIIKSSIDNSNV